MPPQKVISFQRLYLLSVSSPNLAKYRSRETGCYSDRALFWQASRQRCCEVPVKLQSHIKKLHLNLLQKDSVRLADRGPADSLSAVRLQAIIWTKSCIFVNWALVKKCKWNLNKSITNHTREHIWKCPLHYVGYLVAPDCVESIIAS